MSLIDKVLSRSEFTNEPPVLLDIGASGDIHKKWKQITKYSICIAFDADTRDFNPEPEISKKYKKLILKNALVTADGTSGVVNFYLTRSPYCSSLLKPNNDSLKKWAFAPLFEVEKTVQLNCVDINTVLAESNLTRIDWFKSDSQGTDLRLFKSVKDCIRDKIMLAEFEPGILDAYEGEDKLHAILSHMDTSKKFWLSELVLKGTTRIEYESLKKIFKSRFMQKVIGRVGKNSPGWGEMTFLNSFKEASIFTKRDVLLGWVFSTLQGQHGFALALAEVGLKNHNDSIFNELKKYSTRKVFLWVFSKRYFQILFKRTGLID
jgi:hypothetical protein